MIDKTTRPARGASMRWLWLLSAGVLLAACGGGGDGDAAPAAGAPAPAAGGPSPSPSPSPSPAPASGTSTGTHAPAPAPAASPPLAVTQAGVPEGLPSSATIGTAGGTLASSDGRLTISVPAGALSADTVVGIQPITATAPGAFGSGYRLTPEGTTFAQPMTLTFDYPADEAGASVPESLRVATRDARGYWRVIEAVRDTAQRKLSVTTTHFSDWSYVPGVQLAPASATVRVRGSVSMRVNVCGDGVDPDPANAARLLLECRSASDLVNWAVNGISGGNATVGTVASGGLPGTDTITDYTAPAVVPAQNPVAVSADIDDADAGRTTLVSNIRVVDELTVYAGTVFGRIATTIDNQEQFFETSANLRFTYNPDLSIGGDKWYDGSGTAFVHGKPFGCGAGSGTARCRARRWCCTPRVHWPAPIRWAEARPRPRR